MVLFCDSGRNKMYFEGAARAKKRNFLAKTFPKLPENIIFDILLEGQNILAKNGLNGVLR